jgi:hypothetical protein
VKRSRVRPVSTKRTAQQPERDACRSAVLARDRTCRGRGLTPVECGVTPTDVHELGRGAYRASCWLNPDLCIALCRRCHRWVTDHPTRARELGLALAGWEIEQHLKTAGL